ncbi:MAG: hypothetical protein E7598_04490 [Ruminococcaceae bacterium]|nr:hypothetical protein [Oscillospiraceae bacterium]
MRIEKIHIDSFMGSRERDVEFTHGVNIIFGDNESGKSTVSEFIKFMLYGASSRPADGDVSERQKYLSFGDSSFGGYMELFANGTRYRIDRKISQNSSGALRESLAITDLDKKVQVFKGENAGEALLGIPETVFKKVAYISQESEAYTGGAELGSAIENLLFSADETVSTDKALKKLDALRVSLLHKNGKGGLIFDLGREREDLEARLSKALSDSSEIIAKEGSLIETDKRIGENKNDYTRAKKLCELYDNYLAYTRFKAADEAKATMEALAKEKEELDTRYGGFVPDGEYLGRLRHTAETVEAYDRSVTTARAKYENAVTARAAAEEAYTDGGDTAPLIAAAGAIEKVKKSSKLFVIMGAVFLALGISLACAVYLLKMDPALYIASAVAVVAGAVLLVLGIVTKKKFAAMLEKHGAASEHDLLDRAKEMSETGARSQAMLARAREAESTAAALLENEEARFKEAKENFAAEAKRIDGGTESGELFRIVEEYIRAREEIFSREKVILERISQLEKENAAYDRETVEKILGAVGDLTVFEKFDVNEFRRKRDFAENAIAALEIKKGDLEKSLAALRATAQNPALIKATLEALCKKEAAAKARYAAAELAMRSIANASEGLRTRISPRLAEYAGKLMGVMTDGKYTEIGVDSEMGLTFISEGGAHDISYLSKGTREGAYFALRLALIDLVCKDEKIPLILDESFAHADDKRTKQMIKILFALAAEDTQSLVLTCHAREEKIAGTVGIANVIKL